MQLQQPVKNLSNDLVNRIFARLDVTKPSQHNAESLQQLYTAWCNYVPFDNVRKMIALAPGSKKELPGLDASDFFENWLLNGSGATCWPMANAFYELLISIGFNAHRIAGYMRDLGILNHGSVKVTFDDHEWLVEASLLLNTIFPLSNEAIIQNDPVIPIEMETDASTYLLWMKTPPSEDYYCCRLVSEPVEFSIFEERYEASRTTSVFNQRLYAKRNHPGKLIVLWGNSRFSKTINGIEHRELTKDELCESLHVDIGISYSLINEWAACGGLDASFEKPSGPRPPAATMKPPSQRQLS